MVGIEMCGRHLLESVDRKKQLVFPFLDCKSYKLLRIRQMLSLHLVIFNFIFLKDVYLLFDENDLHK